MSLAPPVGFEPTTVGLEVRCAIQIAPRGRKAIILPKLVFFLLKDWAYAFIHGWTREGGEDGGCRAGNHFTDLGGGERLIVICQEDAENGAGHRAA